MDKVFTKPIEKQFEFDESVASVFDDMLDRSIPLYESSIEFVANFVTKLQLSNATICDLGCSTANTLLAIYRKNPHFNFFGYDSSDAMLEMARKKIKAYGAKMSLENADILKLNMPKSDVVIANYMLQFIRPIKREELVKNIYESLNENGYFIFSEKIIYEDKKLHKIMSDLYLEFKKDQGYSEYEISQKREALENVLVPYTQKENEELIKNAGFKSVECLIKWGNFSTFVALK